MSEKGEIHSGSWVKKISKNGKWYLLTSIFTKGAALVLLPVYVSYLTKEEIGVFTTLTSIGMYLPIFISFALESSFYKFFHTNKDPVFRQRLFSTVFWFVLGSGLIVISLFCLSTHFWLYKAYKIQAFPYAYLYFIPLLALQLANLGVLYLSQNLQAKQISVLQIVTAILGIAIGMVLLIPLKMGVTARIMTESSKFILMLIGVIWVFRKKNILHLVFDRQILKQCFKFSFPLIPNALGPIIITSAASLIIANKEGLNTAAVYGLAVNIALLLYYVQDSITQVLIPVISSSLVNEEAIARKKIAEFSLLLMVVMLAADAFLLTYGKQLVKIFANRGFLESASLIGTLGLVYVLGAQNRLYNAILMFHSKNWSTTLFVIISAVVLLVLNLWLVPIYGFTISPYISVFSAIINLVLVFFAAVKLTPVKPDFKKIGIVISAFIVYVISLEYTEKIIHSDYLFFAIKTIMMLTLGTIFIVTGNYWKPLLALVKDRVSGLFNRAA